MARYTSMTSEQANYISGMYSLGMVKSIKPLSGGLANSSYRIVAERGDYIFTITDNKTYEEAEALALLLDHLKNHGFSTSKIIPNDSNELVGYLDEKPILVKEYLHGKVVADLSDTQLFEIGRLMAQLHKIPPPAFLLSDYSYGKEKFYEVTESPLGGEFGLWLKEIYAHILAHLDARLPKGLIHGDLFYDNVIISDTAIALTDFEESCHYYYVFDLGVGITGMCCDDGVINMQKVKHFLEGYNTVRPLLEVEKTHLKAFVVYGAATAAFWRYRQYHILRPDSTMKYHHEEMRKIAECAFQSPYSEWKF